MEVKFIDHKDFARTSVVNAARATFPAEMNLFVMEVNNADENDYNIVNCYVLIRLVRNFFDLPKSGRLAHNSFGVLNLLD